MSPSLFRVFLLEDSRGNIVKLLKLPKEAAERFHEIDDKNSFPLARAFMLWSKDQQDAHPSRAAANELLRSIDTFMDELGGRLAKAIKSKPQIAKLVNVAKTSQELEDAVAKADKKEEPQESDGKKLMRFDDGSYWLRLDKVEHSEEAKEMQHCATDGRGDLVSLRDKEGHPHITMTYNPEKAAIYQIKGKQNRPPVEAYWPFIVRFFEKFHPRMRDQEILQSTPLKPLVDKLVPLGPQKSNKQPIVDRMKQLASDPAVRGFVWPIPEQGAAGGDWQEQQDAKSDASRTMTELGFSEKSVSHGNVRAELFYDASRWTTKTPPPPIHRKDHWYVYAVAVLWKNLDQKADPEIMADPVEYYERNAPKLEEFWSALSELIDVKKTPLKTVLDRMISGAKR